MAATVPSKPVSSPALLALGPILIQPTNDLDKILHIAETQNLYGGDADARIMSDRIDGRKAVVVVLKLGQYRAVIREVTPDIAAAIRPVLWKLRLPNRAIKCMARIDVDPASPTYLNVWLNPGLPKAANARHAKK